MVRFLWSVLISVVVLTIAQMIEWIYLGETLPILLDNATWNEWLWLAIIAVIFAVVGVILWKVYLFASCLTFGLGCLFWPFAFVAIGFAKLWATAYILPGFSHTEVWWEVLILSLLVGVSLPGKKSSD
jgi:hypothetical protein